MQIALLCDVLCRCNVSSWWCLYMCVERVCVLSKYCCPMSLLSSLFPFLFSFLLCTYRHLPSDCSSPFHHSYCSSPINLLNLRAESQNHKTKSLKSESSNTEAESYSTVLGSCDSAELYGFMGLIMPVLICTASEAA